MSEESRREIAAHIAAKKAEEEKQEAQRKSDSEARKLDLAKYNAVIEKIAWPAFREMGEDLKSQEIPFKLTEGKEAQLDVKLAVGHCRLSIFRSAGGELTVSSEINAAPVPRRMPYKEFTKELIDKILLDFVKLAI